eukprot:gene15205-18755_t
MGKKKKGKKKEREEERPAARSGPVSRKGLRHKDELDSMLMMSSMDLSPAFDESKCPAYQFHSKAYNESMVKWVDKK